MSSMYQVESRFESFYRAQDIAIKRLTEQHYERTKLLNLIIIDVTKFNNSIPDKVNDHFKTKHDKYNENFAVIGIAEKNVVVCPIVQVSKKNIKLFKDNHFFAYEKDTIFKDTIKKNICEMVMLRTLELGTIKLRDYVGEIIIVDMTELP